MTYAIRPYKSGFMLTANGQPIRTPDKAGKLVWRTYKTEQDAQAAVATLED